MCVKFRIPGIIQRYIQRRHFAAQILYVGLFADLFRESSVSPYRSRDATRLSAAGLRLRYATFYLSVAHLENSRRRNVGDLSESK